MHYLMIQRVSIDEFDALHWYNMCYTLRKNADFSKSRKFDTQMHGRGGLKFLYADLQGTCPVGPVQYNSCTQNLFWLGTTSQTFTGQTLGRSKVYCLRNNLHDHQVYSKTFQSWHHLIVTPFTFGLAQLKPKSYHIVGRCCTRGATLGQHPIQNDCQIIGVSHTIF